MQHARATLTKIFKEVVRREPDNAPVLAWPLACGAKIAERTTALGFVDGVLTVAVPDDAWQRQLQSFVPAIPDGAESNRLRAGQQHRFSYRAPPTLIRKRTSHGLRKRCRLCRRVGAPRTDCRGARAHVEGPELDTRLYRSPQPTRHQQRRADGAGGKSLWRKYASAEVMRPDEPRPCLPRDEALAECP